MVRLSKCDMRMYVTFALMSEETPFCGDLSLSNQMTFPGPVEHVERVINFLPTKQKHFKQLGAGKLKQ